MSATIRSGPVWFRASHGRAVISQGTIFSRPSLSPSAWKSCTSWCPQRSASRMFVNPVNPVEAEPAVREAQAAARAMGLQIRVLNVGSGKEIDAAFATFTHERPDALLVATGPPFAARRVQLVHLATSHKIPAIYALRQFVEIGGLVTYGASLTDAYRQVGIYAGRILKGAKPAELPVVQATKFELVINAQTARTLGLTVPSTLLARADEVIE